MFNFLFNIFKTILFEEFLSKKFITSLVCQNVDFDRVRDSLFHIRSKILRSRNTCQQTSCAFNSYRDDMIKKCFVKNFSMSNKREWSNQSALSDSKKHTIMRINGCSKNLQGRNCSWSILLAKSSHSEPMMKFLAFPGENSST